MARNVVLVELAEGRLALVELAEVLLRGERRASCQHALAVRIFVDSAHRFQRDTGMNFVDLDGEVVLDSLDLSGEGLQGAVVTLKRVLS